jgi:hypothetical protein
MENNIICFGILVFLAVLARFSFKESARQKKGFKINRNPDFKPLKIKEDFDKPDKF